MRVTVLWLFLRTVTAVGTTALGLPFPGSPVGPPMSTLWIIAAILIVVRVEMWRRSEIIFLANLGHSFGGIAVLVTGQCLVLDFGLRMAVV